ncbi:unnamed protein product [Nippostrongylus brasiliensis]|uniref:Lpxtg-motif cell wall anchor domain protein n=1 Tax=Nippostrongylus brasiliensis TaxID=27835 RepID=A0A0N4Y3Q5_NIPBR|nr:unnamed protein product [Nippostrongylus brasiliensis]
MVLLLRRFVLLVILSSSFVSPFKARVRAGSGDYKAVKHEADSTMGSSAAGTSSAGEGDTSDGGASTPDGGDASDGGTPTAGGSNSSDTGTATAGGGDGSGAETATAGGGDGSGAETATAGGGEGSGTGTLDGGDEPDEGVSSSGSGDEAPQDPGSGEPDASEHSTTLDPDFPLVQMFDDIPPPSNAQKSEKSDSLTHAQKSAPTMFNLASLVTGMTLLQLRAFP